MGDKMKFNVNHMVKVKLTEQGRRHIRTNHELLYHNWRVPPPYPTIEEDADGWSKWQLWRLMQEFGRYITMGFDAPFETEIEIIEGQ